MPNGFLHNKKYNGGARGGAEADTPREAGALGGKASRRQVSKPLTQAQLTAAVAQRAGLSQSEAKRALSALEAIVLDELGNAQKVRLGGLFQLTVRVRPAQKARRGRNPATGEEITIAAKPAAVEVRAMALARAKRALPSVQKARRRLGPSRS